MPVFKRRKPGDAAPMQPDAGVATGPTAFKEISLMARSPFSSAPPAPQPSSNPGPSNLAAPPRPTGAAFQPGMTSAAMTPAGMTSAGMGPGGMNPGMNPSGMGQAGGPARGRDPSERRTLVVGRGISLQGVVQDAERLVVEGTVEATMIHAMELAISPGGVFKGEVEVEDAEVAGTIDGTLTARGNLSVRATGRVLGTARCRRLQVEDGGQITGRMEMLTEAVRPAAAAEQPRSEAAE